MPGRSVLLNVSIIAKGLGEKSMVEEVRELKPEQEVGAGKPERPGEGKRERVDSATAIVAPSMTLPVGTATPTAALTTSSDSLSSVATGKRLKHAKRHR
jgi:hypothetical protein